MREVKRAGSLSDTSSSMSRPDDFSDSSVSTHLYVCVFDTHMLAYMCVCSTRLFSCAKLCFFCAFWRSLYPFL
jgi:hypothetical protein